MLGKLLRLIIPARWRPITYLENHAYKNSGGRVYGGMFKGMRYIPHAYYSAYIPKLLGTYEKELTGAIDVAVASKPELVVDVGAAEGYYAVGLALRLPGTKVVAFEMAPKAQEMLRRMCEMNGVKDQVETRGRCDRADLQELITKHPRALVVIDCEGFEAILLDPLRIPALRTASLLVESHDFILPGIAEELTERFSSTHRVERIWSVDRAPEEYPFKSTYLSLLPDSYKRWVVSEWRPTRMSWLWMEPLDAPVAGTGTP